MIVDTSAVVALILDEPEAAAIRAALVAGAVMSAATYVELGVVVHRKGGEAATRRLDALLEELGIEIVPLTPRQGRLARAAYAEYGRGSGHPAALNLGDCFSYALAADRREQLLFVGRDFVHTDAVSVL
ncbi:type II toxin-antitoxin system VapC family toxin [Occultella kanbiaonis]|uniref:type II toxin-antitoxin system VapC family toxin n=1 Tax=Occultella kanbiaonis TaxID=2675754 RepID=UPI0012B77199|nr:type II toxin-antitoxin system VapC family toxin [Occultella kanbiaonis]